MSKILSLQAFPHAPRGPRAVARTSNVAGYAATAVWFTGLMTALMGVSALLSLARLY